MEKFDVINSIVTRVRDYRIGEIHAFNHEHVERWISQFDDVADESEQLIILKEINRILMKYYVSQQEAVTFIELLLMKNEIFGDFRESYKKVQFLDIQRKGNSQKELLSLLDAVLLKKYNIKRDECGASPEIYIYLDDCMFSGNTLLYDVKKWIANASPNTELHFVFFGLYNRGYKYCHPKIKTWADKKNIKLQYWRIHELGNYEKCLPSFLEEDRQVADYVLTIDEKWRGNLFRDINKPANEQFFSSKHARNVVEGAFMKKGAYIVTLPKNQKPEMRPMGYDKLQTLGFGSLFVTYRNISNNCPLVLWWGDPSQDSSHSLSKWYPLFLRKTNSPIFDPIDVQF